MKCLFCEKELGGKHKKHCGNICQTKDWRLNNRATYLAGKKRYREKNIEKILEY
ncbi:MAG: hypothetical protein IIA49_02175 [Bacteroidetes bacterium]|nr:hypothetical protein [Bacteroidota bacterium]